MRFNCIIGDVHGNLPALETVIREAGCAEMWACAGDCVGYGPFPNECIERLRALGVVGVSGNHDLGSVGRIRLDNFNGDARRACEWTAGVLYPESVTYLEELNDIQRECGWLLVHGSPRDPAWEYVISRETARSIFIEFGERLCFNGHTHSPAVFSCSQEALVAGGDVDVDIIYPGNGDVIEIEEGRCYIANVGSVGQPRDGDPRSCYVEYDIVSSTLTYRRVEYPVRETQKQMEEAGLPGFLIERIAAGR